jgi:DNA modification methylase
MTLPLDSIICGDNCEVLCTFPRECIDLVVTSPPFEHEWDFYGVAWLLKRVIKPGGVIVWIVSDRTNNGSETGASMRQALHFKELGLWLHNTAIWLKPSPAFPGTTRYFPAFEYMFVLTRSPITNSGQAEQTHATISSEAIARDHILSWSNEGDIILDPFSRCGATIKMAREMGRRYIGIEANKDYCDIARKRLDQQVVER